MATPKSSKTRAAERHEAVKQTIWRVAASAVEAHTLATWELDSDLAISLPRLRALLDAHGLDELITPPTRHLTAVYRALKAMASDEQVKKTVDTEDELTLELVRVLPANSAASAVSATTLDEKRATLAHGHMVSYLKKTQQLAYSSDEAERLFRPLIARYTEAYTGQDIVDHIIKPVLSKLLAIKWRGRGGVYLVPSGGAASMLKLRAFIDALAEETGLDCYLSTLFITNDPAQPAAQVAHQDMRKFGYSELVSEVQGMTTRLRDMLSVRHDGERRVTESGTSSVKPETIARHLAQCKEIGDRAALYRDVAQLGIGELNGALRTLKSAYEAVATGLTVGEFDATLARVEKSVARVADMRPHTIQSNADTEDPFALDAADVTLDTLDTLASYAANDGDASSDAVDPFAADAPDIE